MTRRDPFPLRMFALAVTAVLVLAIGGILFAVVAYRHAPLEPMMGHATNTTEALQLAMPGPGRGKAPRATPATPAPAGSAPGAPSPSGMVAPAVPKGSGVAAPSEASPDTGH